MSSYELIRMCYKGPHSNVYYMSCAKYRFVQSMDCPAQSSDRYFAQQSIDLLCIPQLLYMYVYVQSMDMCNPRIVLRTVPGNTLCKTQIKYDCNLILSSQL